MLILPPERNDDEAAEPLRNHSDIVAYWIGFWFSTCTGIALAGGLFGLCAGGIAGLIVGPPIAVIFATPIIVTLAIVMWAFWLSRYAQFIAVAAGLLTGAVSTASVWDPIFSLDKVSSILLATLLGGVVAGYFAHVYHRNRREFLQAAGGEPNVAWHYSLRDMFFRFTIVTLLIALIAVVLMPRPRLDAPSDGTSAQTSNQTNTNN